MKVEAVQEAVSVWQTAESSCGAPWSASLTTWAKVRPDLLIRTSNAWLEDATPERRALIDHALRSAVKPGDADALALLGYGHAPHVSVEAVVFTPRRVRIGGRLAMTFGLKSASRRQRLLLVDVAVHFVKARGAGAPKVFKMGVSPWRRGNGST